MNQIQIKPLIAIVFGSTAKGTFEKTSDIDLLLIYNKKESKDLKLNKDIKAITNKYQYADFDGMTDSTTYRDQVFTDVFGGAKHVCVTKR